MSLNDEMAALFTTYCRDFDMSPQEFISLPDATRIALLKGEPRDNGSLYGCQMTNLCDIEESCELDPQCPFYLDCILVEKEEEEEYVD